MIEPEDEDFDGQEQLRQEVAKLAGISLDEVDDEEVEHQEQKGWSVALDGTPYCLNCGCGIGVSLEAVKGRKRCGTCRGKLSDL